MGGDDSRRALCQWGLGLFIFGVFLTFGIIAHYCVGARWPTGELFKQNIVGLLGVFAVGYPGYFVFDAIWPELPLLAGGGRQECLAAGTGAVHRALFRGSC